MAGKKGVSGRTKGAQQSVTTKARLEAAAQGLLPHEFLLKVARGESVLHKQWKITYHKTNGQEIKRELIEEEFYPSFETRIEAARAAAPFYAPRLATQTVTVQGNLGLSKLTDEELHAEIAKMLKEVPELEALVSDKRPARGTKTK